MIIVQRILKTGKFFFWITLSTLLLTIVLTPVVLNNIDLNPYKEFIENKISGFSGRKLILEGDLKLKLSLQPFIHIKNARFANTSQSEQPQMLTFDELYIQIELLPIFEKLLVIEHLRIKNLVLHAEKDSNGHANWLLKIPDKIDSDNAGLSGFAQAYRPIFKQVQLDDININYQDRKADIQTRINLQTLQLTNHAIDEPFIFNATGTVNTHPFSFIGETRLQTGVNNNDLTLKLDASAIGAMLSVTGQINEPITDNGINVNISLLIPDLEYTFFAATGKSLKSYSINTTQPLPLDFYATLTNLSGNIKMQGIKLKLADSDINGDVSFINHEETPEFIANLHSEKVNINQFLLKYKKPVDSENSTFELSDKPLPFHLLKKINANINYDANTILIDEFKLNAVKLKTKLQSGKFVAKQFDFNLGNAPIHSSLTINNQAKAPVISTSINIKNLDVTPITRRFEYPQIQQGTFSSSIDIKSHGNTLKTIVQNIEGKSRIWLEQVKTRHIINKRMYDFNIRHIDLKFTEMEGPLSYTATGIMQRKNEKEEFSFSGKLTSLASLLDDSATRIRLKANVFNTALSINAHIKKPFTDNTVRLNIELDIPKPTLSLNTLGQLFPDINTNIAIPDLATRYTSQLTFSPNDIIADNIKLNIGNSDLSGQLSINTRKKKPMIKANLYSNLMNADTLLPPIETNDKDTVKPQEKAGTKNKLFSNKPLPGLDALNNFDAVLHYKIKTLIRNKHKISNIELDLNLDNGQLQISPFTADFESGTLKTDFQLSSDDILQFKTNALISKLDYGRLMSMAGIEKYATGKLDAEIHLNATGNSISALMAGLNGQVFITSEGGNLNSEKLKLLSNDIWSKIPFTDDSKKREIRCAVAHFNIENGQVETQALVLDTGTVSAIGTGRINLTDETVSLYVSPRSKRTSVLKLVLVPFNIEGTLTTPSITPDTAGTAFRTTNTAANIALAVATGGWSLLAEDEINDFWSIFVDSTDYCALALAGEKITPKLIQIRESAEDDEEDEYDPDYIEELDGDEGGI